MSRITRALATVTLVALTAVGSAACSAGDDGATGETAASTTSEGMTTTSSSAVPGPDDSEIDLPVAVVERWNHLGGVEGDLGAATGPAEDVGGGSIAHFERGALVLTPTGRVFVVQGEILTAYLDSGGPAGELGFPTADEASTDGGWISTFDGGTITYLHGVAEVELN